MDLKISSSVPFQAANDRAGLGPRCFQARFSRPQLALIQRKRDFRRRAKVLEFERLQPRLLLRSGPTRVSIYGGMIVARPGIS
jgi:hypothetical protein